MEIFLPGLIVILLIAFFIFLVLPRMGPMVLAVVSLVTLIAAAMHHYTLFYSEYKLSTWQYALSAYTPFIVLGFAIIFIITTIMFIVGGPEVRSSIANVVATPMETINQTVSQAVATMPSASSATNAITASINRSINSAPAPAPGPQTNVNRNRRTPNVPGLGFAASEV